MGIENGQRYGIGPQVIAVEIGLAGGAYRRSAGVARVIIDIVAGDGIIF